MAAINVKVGAECKYDIVSLGEIMIRLDPGEERIHTTRHFRAWEGGGEYNVARGLKRCFGKRAAVVTAIVENPVGRLLEDLIYQGGVNTEYIKWVPYDGIGRKVRIGLNFTERGFGVRAAVGCSDRANSAASQLKKGDIDWEKIFGQHGSCWFHTGGIFAGLSKTTPDVIIEAAGKASTYLASIENVAFTGRMVCIGYAKDEIAIATKLFVQKEIDIMGSRNALPDDFDNVINFLEKGKLNTDSLISLIVSPEEASEAMRKWKTNPAEITKILVKFT